MSQFHYGSIKTILKVYLDNKKVFDSLNSTMVRLKQYLRLNNEYINSSLNSTMVRLKQQSLP